MCMRMHMCMSLHVIGLLYPHGAQERGCTACVRSVLLSGWSGCRAVSAAVRPLCAVGLSGSCQAVTLGPDSDGTPLMSGSAVRLSDTCCQAVRESAVNAVRLSGTVRRCPGFAVDPLVGEFNIFLRQPRGFQANGGYLGQFAPSYGRAIERLGSPARDAPSSCTADGASSDF